MAEDDLLSTELSPRNWALTRTIPYQYRWKINQIKLMLNDLLDLNKKHDIGSAIDLYIIIQQEAETAFKQMGKNITKKRKKIEVMTK